jgi:cytochrome P450
LAAELDSIFGDRDLSEWTYEQDLPRLFSGLMGAVMNEELRLVPPVTMILKCTLPDSPQRLTVEGRECTIPGDCSVGISVVAVHRNPKHWAHGRSRRAKPFHPTSNVSNDMEEFRPERWLTSESATDASPSSGEAGESKSDSDESLLEAASDTATALFRPAKGAYVPFSDGARACIGRRFAQVEILAALAVILRAHSVELSVEDWVADEAEVEEMGPAEKRAVWERAREEFERKFREEMGSVITLQLRGKGIKVRMCKRGHEMFDWKEDDGET